MPAQRALPAEGMRTKNQAKAEKVLELREDAKLARLRFVNSLDDLKTSMLTDKESIVECGDYEIEVDDKPRLVIRKRKDVEGEDEDEDQEDLDL